MNIFLGYSGTPPANMVRCGRRKHYLTIESLSSETLDADKTSIMIANAYGKPLTGTFEIKLNDSDWTAISWKEVISQYTNYNLVKACDSNKDTISYGEKLQIRGLGKWSSVISLKVESIGGAKVHGKLSDSLTPEYAASTTSYKFSNFFANSTGLKDASGLDLYDGITFTELCYANMFSGCTSLVNAPQLPATTLTYGCYTGMFSRCTSLVNAPQLQATTLAEQCYTSMFSGCTSLVNAPQLPATTLASQCYSRMFLRCTSLVNAPQLPATTFAEQCYYSMFLGCTNITELHYPKSIENDSAFKGMSGSPKFGATNAIVSYDL